MGGLFGPLIKSIAEVQAKTQATPMLSQIGQATPDTNFLSGTAKAGPYRTSLSLPEETQFKQWVTQNRVPFKDSPQADYDMRGYWRAMQQGDPRAKTQVNSFDNEQHFPDIWKTPYHKSFSRESIYATPNAPGWEGDQLKDKLGTVLVDETPTRK